MISLYELRPQKGFTNQLLHISRGYREGFGNLGQIFWWDPQIDTKFEEVVGLFKHSWHQISITYYK